MKKTDFVAAVAAQSGLEKADALKAVDAFFGGIAGALKKNEDVQLTGFGTFSVSNRAAKTGRNLHTGEAVNIPAAKVPKFKAGQRLKDAVAV